MITPASLDLCCSQFVMGDDSMREACDIMDMTVSEELTWQNSQCQLRTETLTTFRFPDGMGVATMMTEESISSANRDLCCDRQAIGDIDYQGSCLEQ